MTPGNLKVIGVMGWCVSFDHSGSELHINIAVGNDGDLPVHQRQNDGLTHQLLLFYRFIIGIDQIAVSPSMVSGRGGSYLDVPRTIGKRVPDVPESALALFVFNLDVGKSRTALRTPSHL